MEALPVCPKPLKPGSPETLEPSLRKSETLQALETFSTPFYVRILENLMQHLLEFTAIA